MCSGHRGSTCAASVNAVIFWSVKEAMSTASWRAGVTPLKTSRMCLDLAATRLTASERAWRIWWGTGSPRSAPVRMIGGHADRRPGKLERGPAPMPHAASVSRQYALADPLCFSSDEGSMPRAGKFCHPASSGPGLKATWVVPHHCFASRTTAAVDIEGPARKDLS